MLKTYTGGCHCGAVRFEADLDLAKGTFRCNCSICSKTRFWPVVAKPEYFRLRSGESELTEYLFNTRNNRHFFCRRCGVRSFGLGNAPEHGTLYGVNVMCLDGVSDEELASLPITCTDGCNDNWHNPPAETRHLQANQEVQPCS